jgi:hypothetical protein
VYMRPSVGQYHLSTVLKYTRIILPINDNYQGLNTVISFIHDNIPSQLVDKTR